MFWERPTSDPKQSEYHDEIIDLERIILEEFGDYMYFSDVDIYYGEYGVAYIYIRFLRQYAYDTTAISTKPPLQIAEQIRALYNQYISQNPDYYLADYPVWLFFDLPSKYGPTAYDRLVTYSNRSYDDNSYGHYLSTIEVGGVDYNKSSYPYGEWSYFYDTTDIQYAIMREQPEELIIEVADNMPNLRGIIVRDQDEADELSRLRPNTKFVSTR